ncbi:MAG: hypothetical protein ABSB63_16085 [Spirochaetia bacterium]|jgi:hypothetical protein
MAPSLAGGVLCSSAVLRMGAAGGAQGEEDSLLPSLACGARQGGDDSNPGPITLQ